MIEGIKIASRSKCRTFSSPPKEESKEKPLSITEVTNSKKKSMKKELSTGSDLCWMDHYEPIDLPVKLTNVQIINSDDKDKWIQAYQSTQGNSPVSLVHFFVTGQQRTLPVGSNPSKHKLTN